MSDFDDELRRLMGDDRLGLTPRADAVGRIVKGAHRRRTVRVVASAAGSVGLVAALAIGSMAVSGQFSAGPHEPQPAVSPTGLLPGPKELGPDAIVRPTTPASPPASPDSETTEPADPGEEGSGPPDSNQIVLDPDVGIDGFTVGTPLADLQALDGVELTQYGPERGISNMCFGEYASTWAHGTISVRGSWGDYPDAPTPYFEVATMYLDVPFVTPEGIGIGSTEADVFAAYPSASRYANGDLGADLGDQTTRSWVFTITDGLVSQAMLDGVDRCSDPAEDGDEPDLPQPTGGPGDFEPGGYRVSGDQAFAPVWLGMTLAELRQLDGVQITEGAVDGLCYGSFEYEHLFGLISVRRDFASEGNPAPAQSESDYRVTMISSSVPASTTPLGLGPGSSLESVRQAYPDLVEGDTFDPYVPDGYNPAVRWLFQTNGDGTVARLAVDAGQNCAG
ncbi:hypothetical protein [Jiangella endophytica]|uniref:hypothetical protein n=1 Tax=Jiangella endophytica TaxID=1623398 RepID=UPI000E355C27|nr:hypothetical protein [Jiangella endophytica]